MGFTEDKHVRRAIYDKNLVETNRELGPISSLELSRELVEKNTCITGRSPFHAKNALDLFI